MKHKLILLSYLLVFGLFCGLAYNNYQSAAQMHQTLITSNQKVKQMSKKATSLVDQTGEKVVYLAPKGAQSKHDPNVPIINNILDQTFKYDSPKDFYQRGLFVKNHAEGPFYKWWFGRSLKASYQSLVLEANNNKLKRNYRSYSLTKKGKLHYFAVLGTYTELGTNPNGIPEVKYFALDITWNQQTGKWHMIKLPNVTLQ